MTTPLNIIVLEDHDALRELLVESIKAEGHNVLSADCAEDLDDKMLHQPIDVVVLDLALPGEDGISVSKRLRKANPHLYIIMISVRSALEDRVFGYKSGADIYLTKPVEHAELLAAINSVGRRIGHQSLSKSAELDPKQMTLVYERTVILNKDEVAMLKALVQSANHRLPHYRLIEIIGKEVNPSAKANLEVSIGRLRKKMAEAGIEGVCIKAIHGVGYQLVSSVHCV